MSSKKSFLRIPHNAIVLIGDGRKALFLRNEGSEMALNLKTEKVLVHDNPSTREQGSDKPGRSVQSVGSSRSSIEQTDWHDVEEHRFARLIAAALNDLARDQKIPGFVIVAPPRTLADLREQLDETVKKRLLGEIHKDLTPEPIAEIEKHLSAA